MVGYSIYLNKALPIRRLIERASNGAYCTCRDVQERYRTLAMYAMPIPEEEVKLAAGIEQQWKDLFAEARAVDRSLISVKKKFTLVCRI